MTIQFSSSVLFVRDLQVSRAFYEGLLQQKVLLDHGPNIGFEAGFALWQTSHADSVIFGELQPHPGRMGSGNLELYFETDEIEQVWTKMETAGVSVIHPIREQPWGQRVFRVEDPDGYIVELGEPVPFVVVRFLSGGMSAEEVAARMSMPVEIILQIAAMLPR